MKHISILPHRQREKHDLGRDYAGRTTIVISLRPRSVGVNNFRRRGIPTIGRICHAVFYWRRTAKQASKLSTSPHWRNNMTCQEIDVPKQKVDQLLKAAVKGDGISTIDILEEIGPAGWKNVAKQLKVIVDANGNSHQLNLAPHNTRDSTALEVFRRDRLNNGANMPTADVVPLGTTREFSRCE
jgi:hypothetical protein